MAAELHESSHELCRGKVCVVCFNKGTRKVSAGDVKMIQEHIIEGYQPSDTDFPNGICTGCSINLSKKRNDPDYAIPNVNDDYNPGRKPLLRSLLTSRCDCKICNIISKQTGLLSYYSRKSRKKAGKPSTKQRNFQSFKICSNCFSKLYRGCNHSTIQCNSQRKKIDGLLDISSPTSLVRAASRVTKAPEEMPIPTLGRPKNKEHCSKNLFTTDDICGIANDLQLSDAGIKTLARDIRIATGSRKSVESNTMQKVQERSHQLDEYFDIHSYVYQVRDKENIKAKKNDKDKVTYVNEKRPTVLCNDILGLVDKVLEKRERVWRDRILVKIGLDGGGGFFKILLSIFDKDDPFPHVKNAMSKRFKETGVKKAIVIGLVPDIPENYVNVKKLWINLNLQVLPKYTIATDLKLCNIILGMMSHSSCHPCCYCDVHKDNLNRKGKSRTISSLMTLFWNYFESGCDVGDAKKYGNVIHPPMVSDDGDLDLTPVIQIIPPPELHLMTGPVNYMYNALESVCSAKSEEWLKSCNVKKTEYHGGQFTGNDCRKLLKNVHKIKNPSDEVKKYCNAFNAFNEVVISCYGDELKDDYVSNINKFASAYQDLRINITPKIHAVVYHIKEFCSLTKRGLAPWSEQTVESLHSDFKQMWGKSKVKSIDNPIYGEYLLRAVQRYNGKHV